MIITPTKLPGACLIDLRRHVDKRGFFARAWCQKEFDEWGLATSMRQANVSFSVRKGTLRGMHFQLAPWAEVKLVRCTRGAVFDVIVDLRPESPTYLEWLGVELTSENRTALYVPEGFAHGFITLEDQSELIYQVSQFYSPAAERGVRFNDPAFGITWPVEIVEMSAKDRSWPDYVPSHATAVHP